jgi:hypothetical protein
MLRILKWQLPGEPLAGRYNWCQGPVPGRGPAVEKHGSIQPTPYSRVLLDKPTVYQLFKNSEIYSYLRFIAIFTKACQFFLFWRRSIHSSTQTILWSISILSYHLRLGLPIGLLPSDFQTIKYTLLLTPCMPHALPITPTLAATLDNEYRPWHSLLCGSLQSTPPSDAQLPSPAPDPRTPSAHASPSMQDLQLNTPVKISNIEFLSLQFDNPIWRWRLWHVTNAISYRHKIAFTYFHPLDISIIPRTWNIFFNYALQPWGLLCDLG